MVGFFGAKMFIGSNAINPSPPKAFTKLHVTYMSFQRLIHYDFGAYMLLLHNAGTRRDERQFALLYDE